MNDSTQNKSGRKENIPTTRLQAIVNFNMAAN